MEQGEAAVKRAPVLRAGMTFRPLSEGRVYISHPAVASQVLDARVGAALQVCHGQPYMKDELGEESAALPRTETIAAKALQLPLFPSMTYEEQDRVIEVLVA